MVDMRMFRDEVSGWAGGGSGGPVGDLAVRLGVRTAVLLEGPSDLAAVETLAERRGRDLAAEGVCVVQMGGAMSVARYAGLLGPTGLGLRLAGLCDAGEQGFFANRQRRYPSDMTDAEWAVVRPLLPTPSWLEGR
ncbi:TOPRIM nucleotidyl transferase/hydrolase domain-containing protein, partial [Streptomyces sp. NPDC041003]|uniref:TOPRIM nucleotidyl transferase/hydrolase domain-containing protein n=1 Tax=Streptomyces sp. NPDC041003 TaxID=3155730 RepID=UPI0033F74943